MQHPVDHLAFTLSEKGNPWRVLSCDILCSKTTTLAAVMRRDSNGGKSGNKINQEALALIQVRGDGGLDQAEVVKNDQIQGIL